MSCEYDNRCLNQHLCFRCYNFTKLKLPEDVQNKKANSKRKVYTKEIAEADNSWEDLENDMRDALNKIPTIQEARRAKASGALWYEKGDVLDEILKLECKERKGSELKTGDKSMSIKRGWLEKANEEALNDSRIMALPFRFKGDEQAYIIMNSTDIIELVNMIKAYRIDNDVKTEEVRLLKEQIKPRS